jgi:hypothetical protein
MKLVIEERVTPVEDDEVLIEAGVESPEWVDDLADALAWLREHGYRIVR